MPFKSNQPSLSKTAFIVGVVLLAAFTIAVFFSVESRIAELNLDGMHFRQIIESLERRLIALLIVFIFLWLIASIFAGRILRVVVEDFRKGLRKILSHRDDSINRQPFFSEFQPLVSELQEMTSTVQTTRQSLENERNELDAVLYSMAEGLLVVSLDRTILRINQSARRLLTLDEHTSFAGQSVLTVLPQDVLRAFVESLILKLRPAECEMVLDSERLVQAYGRVLHDFNSKEFGILIVLNDITRVRQLENMRRDFVANVSHELKTPITSIKGFVETLLDGAMHNPEDSERFLRIVSRQADRLNTIFEDLLSLSRLEQEREQGETKFEITELRPILNAAIQSCEPLGNEKHIRVTLDCPGHLEGPLNSSLVEQAVVNLISNAMKYSDPQSLVEVIAFEANSTIEIQVRDHGCGIDAPHQERIFERFYRVDRARSRKLGGTGLGLAIVKHIAQAHGGVASVSSQFGKGSTFSITIDKKNAA